MIKDYNVQQAKRKDAKDLIPSLAGSEKRQSTVGLPGNWVRRTDPSGRTSFFRSSKLWLPGLSLHITPQIKNAALEDSTIIMISKIKINFSKTIPDIDSTSTNSTSSSMVICSWV